MQQIIMDASETAFFPHVFGFPESSYTTTQNQLLHYAQFEFIAPSTTGVDPAPYPREKCTFHLPDGRTPSAGTFSFPSVSELRSHVASLKSSLSVINKSGNNDTNNQKRKTESASKIKVTNIVGESRPLHSNLDISSGVIQAASQFNLLEFPSPNIIPEQGISGYEFDRTQGPACAIAAAAGTAYRNYLVEVELFQNRLHDCIVSDDKILDATCAVAGTEVENGDGGMNRGQTKYKQLNGLADVEAWLMNNLKLEEKPWKVKNGYIEASSRALKPVSDFLTSFESITTNTTTRDQIDYLTSLLRIGVQEDCTITDIAAFDQTVTQTYNSAISVGYSLLPTKAWEPIARLVLNGTYEATLLVGAIGALKASRRGRSAPPIYLTKVGGGVFGNKQSWIHDAITRAIEKTRDMDIGVDLDIRIVHYSAIDSDFDSLECNQ